MLLATIAIVYSNVGGQGNGPGVQILGPEKLVFDWSKDACERFDIPDAPARAFRDPRGRIQLIASHYVSRRMVGPSFGHLRHRCGVVMTSKYDPKPSHFADRQWLGAPYTRDGKTIFALVHSEYQGHTHPGRCPSGEYKRCWFNSVTLAVSRNGGRSYSQARPPRQLVATIPYRYVPDSGPAGVFSPSNVVYNRADKHYYALVKVEKYRAQEAGTCVMRTSDLSRPGSWRAWNGSAFRVRFVDPYTETAQPSKHVCQPVSYEEIEKMSQSVTFNTYLDKYVLVGTSGRELPTGRVQWGIYFALSDDLVHWSDRRLIMESELSHTYACGDEDPIAYPSVIDPASSSRTFETAGRRVDLYFTRMHYARCRQTPDRDLVRLPLSFHK